MATKYVRKTGSDSNGGTSPSDAWLTIGKALGASGISSGDTLYIGAGTYRETVTVSVAPTATTQIIGDIDGAYTGDPGEVCWTAWTTNDTTAPSSSSVCNVNSKNFLTFSRIRFVAGTATTGACASNIGHDCTFRECVFQVQVTGGSCLTCTTVQTAAHNLLIERCVYLGLAGNSTSTFLSATYTRNSTADYDANIVIKNCFLFSGGSVITAGSTGAGSFYGGGAKVLSCTLVGMAGSLIQSANTTLNAHAPMQVINCVLLETGGALTETTPNGTTVAENNRTSGATALSGAGSTGAPGVFSKSFGNNRALHLDFGQSMLWGLGGRFLSPYPASFGGAAFLGNAPQGLVYQLGTTAADDATVGTITWTNPSNALSWNDAASATASTIPATTGISHYLVVTGGVGVPSGATIKGIRADVIGTASAISAVSMSSIKLVKAGTIQGNDLASSNTNQWSTGATRNTYGSQSDPLWGLTLTDTDVNASNFGVAAAFKNTSGSARDMNVQGLRLIVSYELAGDYYDVTEDFYNRPRPSGCNVTYSQVGAFEVHDYGVKETSVTHGGSASLKLVGPGDHQFDVPVDAASTTISIYARYDSTHGSTNKPQMVLLDSPDIGVTTATATMTAAADTWEQISFTFTPTAKGIVTIRLRNRAAAASGLAYFDDFAIA